MRPPAPPPPSEYPAWYTGYLAELGEVDPVEALAAQEQELIELLGGLDEDTPGSATPTASGPFARWWAI